MYELIFNIIGALGFVIAVASFMWQVRTYKAERIERVNVQFSRSYGPELWGMSFEEWSALSPDLQDEKTVSALHLYVVNIGQIHIYIKDVALGKGDESNIEEETISRRLFRPSPPSVTNRLEPGEGRLFVLPILFQLTDEAIAERIPKFWISVRSTKGEIYREASDRIWLCIKHCSDTNARKQDRFSNNAVMIMKADEKRQKHQWSE